MNQIYVHVSKLDTFAAGLEGAVTFFLILMAYSKLDEWRRDRRYKKRMAKK